MTIAWLLDRMAGWAEAPALIWADEPYSYGDLLRRVDEWGAELARRRIGAGSVVLVEGGFSPGAASLLLALAAAGAVVVPITPQLGAAREGYAAIAEAQAAFTFAEDDRWTAEELGREVRNPLTRSLIDRGRPGLVIFSSGSTGTPRAVLHDFGALLEKFRAAGRPKSTLSFMLFDHIGGIDTFFTAVAAGGTLVVPAARDPQTVCRTIARHRVHTLPASATFLKLLLIAEAHRRHDLASLQVIAYGSEPMPESTLRALGEALPHVRLVQTYGLSELGVLRARPREPGSLWLKFSAIGFATKVVDGLLWVRSPTAMLGYLNAPDLFDAAGWLNTQDAVEVDGEYLRILGRATELINVGGQKVYPAEVESVLLELANVRDVAVFGEANHFTGQIVAARFNLIEPEDLASLKRRLRELCRGRLAPYKIPVRVEISDGEQFGARFKKLRPTAHRANQETEREQ